MNMDISTQEIVAIVIGGSFAAGLNVYATVAMLGLLGRFDFMQMPQHLSLVESWPVIGVCVFMFLVEFVADKIPAFDMLWNALHTFVRVPVAGVLSYAATAEMSPGAQIAAATVGSTIALVAHGGKMAVRSAVTPSPEPVSNTLLSLGEDVLAIGLVWFAMEHPYLTAGIVALLIVLTIVVIRLVWKAMRALFRGARREYEQLTAA